MIRPHQGDLLGRAWLLPPEPLILKIRFMYRDGRAVIILIPASPPGAHDGKVIDRQGSRQMALSGRTDDGRGVRRHRPGGKESPNRHLGRPPHPSLGSRVPPTVIEAGATVGHYAIIYSSATIHSNATIGDRCAG